MHIIEEEKNEELLQGCIDKQICKVLQLVSSGANPLIQFYNPNHHTEPLLMYHSATYYIMKGFDRNVIQQIFPNDKVIPWKMGAVHPYLMALHFFTSVDNSESMQLLEYLKPTFKIADLPTDIDDGSAQRKRRPIKKNKTPVQILEEEIKRDVNYALFIQSYHIIALERLNIGMHRITNLDRLSKTHKEFLFNTDIIEQLKCQKLNITQVLNSTATSLKKYLIALKATADSTLSENKQIITPKIDDILQTYNPSIAQKFQCSIHLLFYHYQRHLSEENLKIKKAEILIKLWNAGMRISDMVKIVIQEGADPLLKIDNPDCSPETPWLKKHTAIHYMLHDENLEFIKGIIPNNQIIPWEPGQVHPYLITLSMLKKDTQKLREYLSSTFDHFNHQIFVAHIQSTPHNINSGYWLSIQDEHIKTIVQTFDITTEQKMKIFAKLKLYAKIILYNDNVISNINKWKYSLDKLQRQSDDGLRKYRDACNHQPEECHDKIFSQKRTASSNEDYSSQPRMQQARLTPELINMNVIPDYNIVNIATNFSTESTKEDLNLQQYQGM